MGTVKDLTSVQNGHMSKKGRQMRPGIQFHANMSHSSQHVLPVIYYLISTYRFDNRHIYSLCCVEAFKTTTKHASVGLLKIKNK